MVVIMSDCKSSLNQFCQKFHKTLPKYSTKQSQCKKGTQSFTCTLTIYSGQEFTSQGIHKSKKSAEQNTAEQALKHLTELTKEKISHMSPSLVKTKIEKIQSETEKTKVVKKHENISLCDSQVRPMTPDSSSSPAPQTTPRQDVKPSVQTPSPNLTSSKSILNEYALGNRLTLPSYKTFFQNGSFISIVTFNEVQYQSKGFHKIKKDAEKSAALAAVEAVQNKAAGKQNTSFVTQPVSSSTPQSSVKVSSSKSTPDASSPQLSYKNVLQEYMQQRRQGEVPKYEVIPSEVGLFRSKVIFSGKTAESTQGFPNKKDAEQSAAREALVSLGIEDPEELAARKKGKGKAVARLIRLQPLFDQIHQIRKRQRLDDNNSSDSREAKKLKLESLSVEKEAGAINFLTVGEIWKEKGNVALVGNKDTSFILYCTRVANSLELLNTRVMLNHRLEPGHRIIGLDAEIVEAHGKLVLQAERCADIEVPTHPDPVLISCGVVILHQNNQDSSHIEVLLKRYLVSQAFVNVKAAMAQFFRRSLAGNPVPLPVHSLTEHIETWKLDEVVAVATMTGQSIKQVFSIFWKFKDQWSAVLEPPLPRDLQQLQARAQRELEHRIALGINITDFENHPWSLPKGNFRHRMLTSGLHIEKPTECAARELCEETGIELYSHDLEKVPYVDLPQDDNLNPHRGDLSRYFLYVYSQPTDSIMAPRQMPCQRSSEDSPTFNVKMKPVSLSQLLANEDPDSASETPETKPLENEPTFFVLDDDSGPEASQTADEESRNNDGKNTNIEMEPVSLSELLAHEDPASGKREQIQKTEENEPTFFVLDDLGTSMPSSPTPSSSSPQTKATPLNTALPDDGQESIVSAIDAKADSTTVALHKEANEDNKKLQTSDIHLNTEIQENRGKKRKRSISDEADYFDESNISPLNKSSPSSYQSPSVKGGQHEECAWFKIEEAIKISPVFVTIYEDQKFVDLLESLKT